VSEQVTYEVVAVEQNADCCSSCSVCSTLCPYEALSKDAKTGKITLDITKCQVCGLCYANCPASVISVLYYDLDSLVAYLEKAKQEYASDTLVIMCRGSAPDTKGVEKLFGISGFIPLLVPCVGRVPDEIYLRALLMGIKKIDVLACDEDYCRFERGSAVTHRKITAINILLDQLGYGRDIITLKEHSLKVQVDANLCIACGNCVFYCPYDAAELKSPGGISFNLDACRGCGLCVAMCPALALELENWERERISRLIKQLSVEMKPPKVLAFRCQWASFPSLDSEPSPHIRYIDLPCASRIDRFHVLEALQQGIDGVMIAACSEDDCKQERASGRAQHSMTALGERLDQIGLKERVHFCSVSPRYPEQMDSELERFTQKIAVLGKGGSV
jgi:coenzyme F420-reducing hydrogenase delta subunit/ferredoxin